MENTYAQTNTMLHKCCYENCNKAFKSSFSLKRHEFLHQNQKNFVCNICHKNFALFQYLKEHSYIHTGETPYICGFEGCSKKFRQACKLCIHRKTHEGYTKAKAKLPTDIDDATQAKEIVQVRRNFEDETDFFDFSSYFIKIRKHEQLKRDSKMISHMNFKRKMYKCIDESDGVSAFMQLCADSNRLLRVV